MKKSILWISGILLTVLLFVGAIFLYNKLSADYKPDNISGESTQSYLAPDFTVVDGSGNEIRLSAYFGKPIVLNFWASWCPPCKEEMPHFEAAYKTHTDLQFLMVNMTTSGNESLSNAKSHISENGYTFPVLFDTKGEAATTYGASSLPVTFFIDKNGKLITYAVGMLDAQTLEKGINMIK